MKEVIFIHGYEGYPEKDWFPNIAKALKGVQTNWSILAFPGGKDPYAKDWLELLDKEIKAAASPIVLVAYSLGTRAALLYLEQHQPKNIDTVILIAPFNNDWQKHIMKGYKGYNTFFEHAIDIAKVKKLAKQFIVMHSKDDPHVKYAWGKQIAKDLNAKMYTFEHRDHFYHPENYKYVLDVLKTVL